MNCINHYLNEYQNIINKMYCKMMSVCLSDSISYNFIVQFLPYRYAGIKISANLLNYSLNEDVQDIAFSIIKEQTSGINNMLEVKDQAKDLKNTYQDLQKHQEKMNQIIEAMLEKMTMICKDNINQLYLEQMLIYYQAGIDMAKETIQYHVIEALQPILEGIIYHQQQTIDQINKIKENS
ncbi:DUF305 domain-containing protein [Erysipelatoclostridium sp. AM42-17]|uniref:DUF305 domain-containing protein n=1 Tax=Erysipelatoclostridium sp. AM42-17 TaxID=2293102 RepID=UPI000E4B5EBD|nr:DUF305 domain-containing protein [Erysipelatoclostridium sp. AM42-17]RHS92295.1 DUF305 domain-containing protein [Erysipelatoclostridium sp. AM42-17]